MPGGRGGGGPGERERRQVREMTRSGNWTILRARVISRSEMATLALFPVAFTLAAHQLGPGFVPRSIAGDQADDFILLLRRELAANEADQALPVDRGRLIVGRVTFVDPEGFEQRPIELSHFGVGNRLVLDRFFFSRIVRVARWLCHCYLIPLPGRTEGPRRAP